MMTSTWVGRVNSRKIHERAIMGIVQMFVRRCDVKEVNVMTTTRWLGCVKGDIMRMTGFDMFRREVHTVAIELLDKKLSKPYGVIKSDTYGYIPLGILTGRLREKVRMIRS
jgi:hypothetical protein